MTLKSPSRLAAIAKANVLKLAAIIWLFKLYALLDETVQTLELAFWIGSHNEKAIKSWVVFQELFKNKIKNQRVGEVATFPLASHSHFNQIFDETMMVVLSLHPTC